MRRGALTSNQARCASSRAVDRAVAIVVLAVADLVTTGAFAQVRSRCRSLRTTMGTVLQQTSTARFATVRSWTAAGPVRSPIARMRSLYSQPGAPSHPTPIQTNAWHNMPAHRPRVVHLTSTTAPSEGPINMWLCWRSLGNCRERHGRLVRISVRDRMGVSHRRFRTLVAHSSDASEPAQTLVKTRHNRLVFVHE